MGSHVLPGLPDSDDDPDRPWWLRLLRHAPELALTGYSTTIGAVTLFKADDPSNFAYGPLQYLPTPLTYVIASLVCLGGALALLGISIRIKNLKLELVIEQVGWFLMAIGWTAYIVGAHGYGEIGPTTLPLIWISLGAMARVIALVIHQHLLARKQAHEERVDRLVKKIEGTHAD